MSPKIRRWLFLTGLVALIGGPLLGAAAQSRPCHAKVVPSGSIGLDAGAGGSSLRGLSFDAPTRL
jgi:hypothetical protein